MRISSLLLFISLTFSLAAREVMDFSFGTSLRVLADKAYRKTQDNSLEAVGNVVIIHGTRSLYGEKASMRMTQGEVVVVGNVRFVDIDTTIYASKVEYNLHTQKLVMHDARILSDNLVIVGKMLSRVGPKTYEGINAEYSTCQDCPESWSISGKKVTITTGEYVKIEHAFFKIKGVIATYFPYLVFPIKKKRESGLLFPKISYDFEEGITYQQPWFLATSESSDMTISPSLWGKRGFGTEVEARAYYAPEGRLQFDTIMAADKIYSPYRLETTQNRHYTTRSFSMLEHHYSAFNRINHHLTFNWAEDLDIYKDFSNFTQTKNSTTNEGLSGFVEYRHSLFDFSVEGHHKRNHLVPDPQSFDSNYVQILPKLSLSTIPISLYHSKSSFLKEIALGSQSDLTIFSQSKFNEGTLIRNAKRTTLSPYLLLSLGDVGPVGIKTRTNLDYYSYDFEREPESKFRRTRASFESEISLSLEKIFGVAYKTKQTVPPQRIEDATLASDELVSRPPQFKSDYTEGVLEVVHDSYRHTQDFKVKHFYTATETLSGNEDFRRQIQLDQGVFDSRDLIHAKTSKSIAHSLSTSLPIDNTLELTWSNTLTKKSIVADRPWSNGHYLRDNFSYQKVSYFNLSQGFLPEVSGRLKERITRLYGELGVSYDRTSFTLSDYYFYNGDEHVLSTGVTQSFDLASITLELGYDTLALPERKTTALKTTYYYTDSIGINMKHEYDMVSRMRTALEMGVSYLPSSRCIRYDLTYAKTLIDSKLSFNFNLNFNETNFSLRE